MIQNSEYSMYGRVTPFLNIQNPVQRYFNLGDTLILKIFRIILYQHSYRV